MPLHKETGKRLNLRKLPPEAPPLVGGEDVTILKRSLSYFINVPMCEYMITYLKEPDVLISGNAENSIKLVRSWEDSRYGFRTTKGLQDHLKLYQKMKYLG